MAELLRKLRDRVYFHRDRISSGQVINQQKEELRERLLQLNNHYNILRDALENVSSLAEICQMHAVKYRDMRIAELEERCEAILALAFPDEDFGVRIKSDVVRKKEVSYLLVGPKNKPVSQWFTPVSENGGLVKQLLGASLIASICEMCGASYIFFDEMFCSGDPVTVADISPFFKSLLDKGIQLAIIEHKPTLYEGVTRHEIHLGKDRINTGAVRILRTEDKEPEE